MARWCLEHQDRDDAPGTRHFFWATHTLENVPDLKHFGAFQAAQIAGSLLAVFGLTDPIDTGGWRYNPEDEYYFRRYQSAESMLPADPKDGIPETGEVMAKLWITDERSKNTGSREYEEFQLEIFKSKLG